MKSDASTAQTSRELSSLQLSLDQYSGRNQSLNYYGFLGHFSAGKTTTINSLLKSDDPRPTDQHPTNTSITIITHKNNQASLIGTHRRGELAVGTSLKENELRLETVIVDTPGSGDPTIVEEMVRDFLPICDTLIYVLSATAPLDNSDVPTLKKTIDELPFIPIKFVVTRANEFIKDTQKIFSEDNYDAEKANDFCTKLSRRLQNTIQGLSISPEDIILIDNISGYNIDLLKYIIFSGEKINTEQLVKLHTHKVAYFAQPTDHLRTLFVNHIMYHLHFEYPLNLN
ncbi:MAG: 50S ribosome-binding GTPase [gamma proteobacterium symbiont of Taylorina sp.]|nr:50S ribosome-binding GTPase [gamma proteobacterium symbiont of Taylorina sp.]